MAKFKIFVSFILCVLLFTFCVSCTPSYGDEDDFIEKPIYEQVINTTNNIATKSIYSNTNLKFIFYKYDGTPCRINENILLNRINDGVDQFISLNVHTTEISSYVQDLVNTFIGTLLLFFIVKWRPSFHFSFERFKKLFSFGWKVLASGLIAEIYEELRGLIIAKKYTTTDFSFYSKANSFRNFLVIMSVQLLHQLCFLFFLLSRTTRKH